MADASYVYTEIPVDARVTSSQRSTPEGIVEIAKTIWKKIGESGVPKEDDPRNDALLERLQDEFKDFNASFPIVLRWMVQLRKFSPEALRKYLLKHAAAKLDTREGFLELQVEYLVLLYRETHRHPDEGFIRQYRESLTRQLLEEDKAFLEMQKTVEMELAEKATVFDRDRRQRLYEFLIHQKVAREQVAAPGAAPGAAPKPQGSAGRAPSAT